MSRALIIGCGNPLRSDDGVAWHIVKALQNVPHDTDVEARAVQQLTPELAEDVSKAKTVVFIDAATAEQQDAVVSVPVRELASSPQRFTHSLNPAKLLSVAQNLYRAIPENAFLVSVRGSCFEVSEELSEPASRLVNEAVQAVQSLIAMRP